MAARRRARSPAPPPAPSAFARATSQRQRLRLQRRRRARRCTWRRYDLRRTVPRVVRLPAPTPLERWCREHAVAEAIVGGFFVAPGRHAAGRAAHERHRAPARPFDAPWGDVRACLHVVGGHVRARAARRAARRARPATCCRPARCSSRDGAPCVAGDVEGFSAGAGPVRLRHHRGPLPARRARRSRAAGGCWPSPATGAPTTRPGSRWPSWPRRSSRSAPRTALNLDGGGSTSLVCGGRLRNVPREDHGVELRRRPAGLDRDRVHAAR